MLDIVEFHYFSFLFVVLFTILRFLTIVVDVLPSFTLAMPSWYVFL